MNENQFSKIFKRATRKQLQLQIFFYPQNTSEAQFIQIFQKGDNKTATTTDADTNTNPDAAAVTATTAIMRYNNKKKWRELYLSTNHERQSTLEKGDSIKQLQLQIQIRIRTQMQLQLHLHT